MVGENTAFNADKRLEAILSAKTTKKNCYFLEKKREFLNFFTVKYKHLECIF